MSILQFIFGFFLLCLGIYGVVTHWWIFVDLASVIIDILLVLFGTLSIIAGISSIREKAR
ncbi:MAG: hypothetical protein HQK64_00150 [Desulfamplus sp.]|nr:hypothetical protein [Desulfamplus sp.]MBF0388967.1 hypothetical protein [Desulfamplus sp.]